MRKLFFVSVLTLVVVGLFMTVYFAINGTDNLKDVTVAGISIGQNGIMQDNYFYANNFYHSLDLADTIETAWPENKIRAGIIPHDITQGQMMANFFLHIAKQTPQRIIILGPNHYEKGSTNLITTTADWKTEFGIVETDDIAIEKLMDNPVFSMDREIIENEHAVSAVVPYISYYLPDAQVVPIIFKADMKKYNMDNLISQLSDIIDDNTIIVASVDFSHYLDKNTADRNDELTIKYLKEFDYQSILNLGDNFNDYLDSPAVIGLLLKWLDKMGYNNYELIDHTNSADQDKKTDIPTTSYFEIIYY